MKTEVIRTWEAFALLEREWNDLLRASRADTVFLTWEWISSWLEVAGQNVEPVVIVVRDGRGHLAGVVPLYRAAFIAFRSIPVRALRVMADQATGAEYAGWIVRRDAEAEAAQEIARRLRELRGEWDLLWMRNVRGWDGLLEVMVRAAKSAGMGCRTRPRGFAHLDLPGTPEEFRQSLSRNRREQLRRQERGIRSLGAFVVRCCATQEDLPGYLEALFSLNAERWSSVGGSGTFVRRPEEAAFYRVFAPKALGRGWLRLFALESAGRFRAVQAGYVYGGVYHQLQEGFAPDFVAGAGNVLRLCAIERLILEGVRGYDFLGGTSEHKRRWTAQWRTGFDVLMISGRARNRWFSVLRTWPTGRFMRPLASTDRVHA